MRIAITSKRLEIPSEHSLVLVNPASSLSENEFRTNIQLLTSSEYFVTDRRNKLIGAYIGFCLGTNIPFITVGLPQGTFHGAYAHLSRREWREFIDKLTGEYTELELAEDISRHHTELLDSAGLGRLSV